MKNKANNQQISLEEISVVDNQGAFMITHETMLQSSSNASDKNGGSIMPHSVFVLNLNTNGS